MTEYQLAIEAFKNGNMSILKQHRWLMFLGITKEEHVNLEHLRSKKDLSSSLVLEYVRRTLQLLEDTTVAEDIKDLVATVLIWSEVSKTGLPWQRKNWLDKGYNIDVHNEGSADIFLEACETGRFIQIDSVRKYSVHFIASLIRTHGLVGQYLRGEVSLEAHKDLIKIATDADVDLERLYDILFTLNYCVIAGVKLELWETLKESVVETINHIIHQEWNCEFTVVERIQRLRRKALNTGDRIEGYDLSDIETELEEFFRDCDLWYVESALSDFSFDQFKKIVCLCAIEVKHRRTLGEAIEHMSFEPMMHSIYYDYSGQKCVNVYKKRIIEHFLKGISIEEIKRGEFHRTPHILSLFSSPNRGAKHSPTDPESRFSNERFSDNTLYFDVTFSEPANRLIDFCVEAERSEVLYEKAIILLYDLFGLRHDAYDRFNEEERYLSTMNQSIDYKKLLLDYIVGDRVLDIGPGGGAFMDLIETRYPKRKVYGIDISANVIDTLIKKKNIENKRWNVVHGNALNLKESFRHGEIDTIIFCSIMHELFSYIEFEGKQFNHNTLKAALQSSFDVLPVGGRIIIRDGIMSEPVTTKRIIRFLTEEGMAFLERYQRDFKGREIMYEKTGLNEVIMPINDAMEFLYTYTWGEKSYVHEVQEQFGYFTPSEFKAFIEETLGEEATIIEFKHFLQEGYSIALAPKIEFFTEHHEPVSLPDSTCIVVIEKRCVI